MRDSSDTTTMGTRAEQLLLEFLRHHDAACPVCGNELRRLARPVCPECRQSLVLTAGAARLRLGWLFAAVAPGFFSGIAACFVLILVAGRLLFGDGRWSPALTAIDLFGLLSGLGAIILIIRRRRFLALPLHRQRWWAATIWAIHFAAFFLFILATPRYL